MSLGNHLKAIDTGLFHFIIVSLEILMIFGFSFMPYLTMHAQSLPLICDQGSFLAKFRTIGSAVDLAYVS